MFPKLSISTCSEIGLAGRPGIVVIFPVIGTKNPAPAENLISLTVILNPVGFPRSLESSEREYCVFAIHIGSLSNPSFLHSLISFSAVIV